MPFLEERDFRDIPRIRDYFRGKTVFITGGSGFLGKVLIEKLLYACTDLDRIYLLLRSKKGVEPEDRLSGLYNMPCFDRLRRERPGVFESKVFIIAGDVGEPNLGMSDDDRALIVSRTNIIFHSAASVRFNDHIRKAVRLNMLGTQHMLELAKEVHHLESFVHVSTAYSNRLRDVIKEVLYPADADWRELIKLVESVDAHTLQTLTPKILGDLPNTYVLTKQLAEHMVYEEKGKLPIVIVRPSIVTSSAVEPIPGWNENYNGPTGIGVMTGTGLITVVNVAPDIKMDYIPVDVLNRAIITAAWVRGTKKLSPRDDVTIYNACGGGHFNFSNTEFQVLALNSINEVPFVHSIWLPSTLQVKSSFWYHFVLYFKQLLPIIIIDALFWIINKPRLLETVRHAYIGNKAVGAYLLNEWNFTIDNFFKLRTTIKQEDLEDFYYTYDNIDPQTYFTVCTLGAKRYLLHEKDEDLPKAIAKRRRFEKMSLALRILFFLSVLYVVITSRYTASGYEKLKMIF